MTSWFTSASATTTTADRLRQQSEKGRAAQEVALAAQALRFRDWLLTQCDKATHSGAEEWISTWELCERFDELHDAAAWSAHHRWVHFDVAQRAVQMLRAEGLTVLSSAPLCRGGVSGVRLTISWRRTEAEKPPAGVV